MRGTPLPLLLAIKVVLSMTTASAQGTYFVNGLTGQDIPASGGSRATPWKTIGYAFQRIPLQIPPSGATLYIEGNQVYSPATNGETLPITPGSNIWVEAEFPGGQMPILRAPAGATFFRLSPGLDYNRNADTYRYLVFEGGAVGIEMGAQIGQRHRPRIQDCRFRGQTRAGIWIRDQGNAIQDPRVFQTAFENLPIGIEIVATSNAATIRPDVEECTFDGATNAGVFLNDVSVGGVNIGGVYRSNWFRRCNRGIHVRVGRQAATTNFYVFSSTFADITQEGVWIELQQAQDPDSWIEQCSFLRCGIGVRFAGVTGTGPFQHTLLFNTARDCGTGFLTNVDGIGTLRVRSEDNLAQNCETGLVFAVQGTTLQYLTTSLRDRALRNRTSGFVISDTGGSNGSQSLMSAMACGNGDGLRNQGGGQVTVRSCTLADNAVGVRCANAANKTMDHLVFSQNGADIVGAPAINRSCFQNGSYAGTGNLNNTNPQLLRPLYKLAPSSPCIDAGSIATPLPATDYEGDPRASVSQQGGGQIPDLGADEYVFVGSVRKYGTKGFGWFNFFPEISSGSVNAIIGQPVDVKLSGAIQPAFARPANGAVLTLGLQDDPGLLPYELAIFGAPGSLVWTDALVFLGPFPVSATGTAALTFTVPPVGTLIGQTFTFQWFALLNAASAAGFVTSDGLRMTIGR